MSHLVTGIRQEISVHTFMSHPWIAVRDHKPNIESSSFKSLSTFSQLIYNFIMHYIILYYIILYNDRIIMTYTNKSKFKFELIICVSAQFTMNRVNVSRDICIKSWLIRADGFDSNYGKSRRVAYTSMFQLRVSLCLHPPPQSVLLARWIWSWPINP